MRTKQHTAGFKSELYDTRISVYAGKSSSTENTFEQAGFSFEEIIENRYFNAVITSMNDWLNDELRDVSYAPERFLEKVEAARLLFDKDRKMITSPRARMMRGLAPF